MRDPERVPLDSETQQRVTGNPLMLSMVISIFQSKQYVTESAMPTTITELYETASRAMLERVDRKERGAAASAAAVPHLTSLLEATFFEAHAAEVRTFGDEQLNRAALALFAPDKLKELGGPKTEDARQRSRVLEMFSFDELQEIRDKLKLSIQRSSKIALIYRILKTEKEKTLYLNLDVACNMLPAEAKEALRAVRERVAQDRLPLLSLLEAEPLQMQSSHLSFQEYFAVRAICTGKHRLPRGSLPWKWGPFWSNVVKLGRENGTVFSDGLLLAAGVECKELNLCRQLGGDRPTVLPVVCALMGSLRVLNLSNNKLGPEGGATVSKALNFSGSLTSLNLYQNQIGDIGGVAIAEALTIASR